MGIRSLIRQRYGDASREGAREEVLGDFLGGPRPRWLLGCALFATLWLTGCTSDHDSASDRGTSAAVAHRSADAQAEKRLTAQVRAALDAVTKPGASMVASGTERVSDGVHTQPGLAGGAAYQLTVVCAGKGDTEIEFTPTGAGSERPVRCDGSVVTERFTARGTLRLDVRGRPGSAGMIAWRIDTF
ncbi:hypothetical protein [Streptomyces fagopyri]|uniref:hypothetical protein n=1 Tax=Streptomyces fagopyri TaxID=2662397 RepID=UPI0037166DA6